MRIKEKAAVKAFKSSIYMWTFVVLFLIDMEPRARDNLTQVELAQKVGVQRETIVFLEKGNR